MQSAQRVVYLILKKHLALVKYKSRYDKLFEVTFTIYIDPFAQNQYKKLMDILRPQSTSFKRETSKKDDIFVDKGTFYGKKMHIRRGIRRIDKINLKENIQITQKCQTLDDQSRSYSFSRKNLTQSESRENYVSGIYEKDQLKLFYLKIKQKQGEKDIKSIKNCLSQKQGKRSGRNHQKNVQNQYQNKIMKKQLQKNKIFRLSMKSDTTKKTYQLEFTDNRLNLQSAQTKKRSPSKIRVGNSFHRYSKKQQLGRMVKSQNRSLQNQQKLSISQSLDTNLYRTVHKSFSNWTQENEEDFYHQAKKSQKQVFILDKTEAFKRSCDVTKRKSVLMQLSEDKRKKLGTLISHLQIRVDNQNMVGPWSKKIKADSYEDQSSR